MGESHLDANHLNFLGTTPYGERLSSTDVLPGTHAGYNYQLPSGWVLGGEADFTYPDSDSEFIRRGQIGNIFDKFTFKNRLQGAIRGRIGYSVDNFLPYITAGVSFTDTGLRYDNEVKEVFKKDSVQAGWILGDSYVDIYRW